MSDIFKQASQTKLRFKTTRGVLSTEQLWDLPLPELDALAVELDQQKGEKKSFLDIKSDDDKIAKLKFDIVLEVLNSKVAEQETLKKARETKEHNEKILSLIKNKQDESLKDKSIEELEKLLK